MSNRVYHKSNLRSAWQTVSNVLFYEQSWEYFYEQFPNFQVQIRSLKVFEIDTNWSPTTDAEVELVKLLIHVQSPDWKLYSEDLYLSPLEIRCIDRLNYPKGFKRPDPSRFQNIYLEGFREFPKDLGGVE